MKKIVLLGLLVSFQVQAGWKVGPIKTLDGSAVTHYQKVNGDYVREGDILVEPLSIVEHFKIKRQSKKQSDDKAVSRRAGFALWKKGVIPYEIDPSIPNQKRLLDMIDYYHTNTQIKLVPRTNEKDYVYFKNNGSDGCSSFVGRKGGKQKINVPDWCGKGSLIHEVMHALGFYHEQSRMDRHKAIKVKWGNIQIKQWPNFFRAWFSRKYGQFDFDSIMLYSSFNGFARDREKPTLTRRDGSTWRANRTQLSDLDAEALGELYRDEFLKR